jgi:hypothetical protein
LAGFRSPDFGVHLVDTGSRRLRSRLRDIGGLLRLTRRRIGSICSLPRGLRGIIGGIGPDSGLLGLDSCRIGSRVCVSHVIGRRATSGK